MSTEICDVPSTQADRSAELALIAHHFVSQFQGEQWRQCQAVLSEIFRKNSDRVGGELSFGLKGLIQKALQAAYQQGYMECNQSSAGQFHLDIDVPMPSILFAVKVNSALKFAIQTAYTLGRKHGKADQQGAIAAGEPNDDFGLWLWAKLMELAYYLRLTKQQDSTSEESRLIGLEHSIYSFDTALIIYCQYRFGTEDIETLSKVGLLVERMAKTWKPSLPLPPEPGEASL